MRAEGVSFRHAVELLRDGIRDQRRRRRWRASTVREAGRRRCPSMRSDDELLGHVVDFYRRRCSESPEALAYLARRRLDHPEAIERFRLGYANRTLGYRLPEKNRKDGAATCAGACSSSGSCAPAGTSISPARSSIPVSTRTGDVPELYGRKIRDDLREGTPLHLYLPGPHRGVWNLRRAGRVGGDHLVRVADRRADVLVRGFRHVTARYGVERLHRRSPRGASRARVRAGADRLRPRRRRRQGRARARRVT